MILLAMMLILIGISYRFAVRDLVVYEAEGEREFHLNKREINIYSIIAGIVLWLTLLYNLHLKEFNINENIIKWYVLLSVLWPLIYIDMKTYRIPNVFILLGLIYRGIVLGLELILYSDNVKIILQSELIGFIILSILLGLCCVCAKGSIGYGDIKLLLVMSVYLGVFQMLNTLMVIMIVAFILGIGLLVTKKKQKKDSIPFAPAIVVGTYIYLLLGM